MEQEKVAETETKTERQILKSWLDREEITYDMDMEGADFMGDPANGFINGALRIRTKDALVAFFFRKDNSLAEIRTQPYNL